MKSALPKAIKTIEEAKQFLTELYNNGEAFHPEDNAHDVEWSVPQDQQPTKEERDQLNRLMNEIYEAAKGSDFDPCEFLLELDPEYIKNRDADKDDNAR
jgi:hypothetical protein